MFETSRFCRRIVVGQIMGWLNEESKVFPSGNLANAGEIVNLVSESRSVSHAVEIFSEFLRGMSCNLLIVEDYDRNSDTDSNLIWFDLPSEFEKLHKQHDNKSGSPVVQQSLRNESAIEALSFYHSGLADALSMKFLSGIKELGYDQLAIVPINAGTRAFVAFIGLRDQAFEGKFREQICLTFAQFLTALFCRYPLLSSRPVGDSKTANFNLSKREKECLSWSAQGKTSYEISIILKLSEHTINNYISNACRRLDAANKSHAVAKAIQLGIIENDSLY